MSKAEIYKRLFSESTYDEFESYCMFNYYHRRYSPFNCALIMSQRPGAMYVQTEATWNKEGYFLKPEAIPIIIMQVGGPVTLVYDREDVIDGDNYFIRDTFEKEKPQGRYEIDEYRLQDWKNSVHKKGIRVAEGPLGERQGAKVEPLKQPMTITYIERKDNKIIEKTADAYHQITLNSRKRSHEKGLALLHELGHLYCGHIPGKRDKKINSLPDYRFEDLNHKLNAIKQMISEQQELLGNIDKNDELCLLIRSRIDELEKQGKSLITNNVDQKEYEAEMVCKLLCERNGYFNNSSDSYLSQHTVNGKIPDIELYSVMSAIEMISKILNI